MDIIFHQTVNPRYVWLAIGILVVISITSNIRFRRIEERHKRRVRARVLLEDDKNSSGWGSSGDWGGSGDGGSSDSGSSSDSGGGSSEGGW